MVSAEFSKKVLLPQNDPTEQAENIREQLAENLLLGTGIAVPVSPRDNHIIHLEILQQKTTELAGRAKGNIPAWHAMEMLIQHAVSHIQAAEQAGQKKQVAIYKLFFTKAASTLIKLHQTRPGFPGGPPAEGGPTQTPQTPAEQSSATESGATSGATYAPIHEAIQISYKDFPEDIKRQVEAKLGLTPSTMPAPTAGPAATAPPASPQPPNPPPNP